MQLLNPCVQVPCRDIAPHPRHGAGRRWVACRGRGCFRRSKEPSGRRLCLVRGQHAPGRRKNGQALLHRGSAAKRERGVGGGMHSRWQPGKRGARRGAIAVNAAGFAAMLVTVAHWRAVACEIIAVGVGRKREWDVGGGRAGWQSRVPWRWPRPLPRGGGVGGDGSKIRVSLCFACHLALLSSQPTAAVWSLHLSLLTIPVLPKKC